MSSSSSDMIAAIATPVGEGGISVVRISGQGTCRAIDRIFQGKHPLASVSSHTAHFGILVRSNGEVIDQVVATVFHAPHSYTGEETVELSCHGGIFVTGQILNSVIDIGCRHARPGEFTQRAFLNGRIDLIQAEAIADLIHAGSEAARRSSIEQLRGRLSVELKNVREELIRITGLLELELDFVEEDIELTTKKEVVCLIKKEIERIEKLIESYHQGRIYREGVRSVIAGRPNAGKSSLLNALLKHDRAIVSTIPGTTRDTIEENISLNGILFRLTDTAGLRKNASNIEKEGITRAEKELRRADCVIYVADSGKTITEIKNAIAELTKSLKFKENAIVIVAVNKIDLQKKKKVNEICDKLKNTYEFPCVPISAKKGTGIEELERIMGSAVKQKSGEESLILTNARHRDSLVRSLKSLRIALQSTETGLSDELIVLDLRAALNGIGEIIGETTTDDILNKIFSSFCIGK